MERSLGLLLFLKKPKNFDGGEMPIYLRLTVNGVSKEVSLRKTCSAKNWNPELGFASARTPDGKSVNDFLEIVKRKVYEVRRKLMDSDQEVSAENIKTLLQDRPLVKSRKMLMEVFQQHNDNMKALVGKEYAQGTLERYITSFKHTRAFMQCKLGTDDIDIAALNFQFISEYEFWLKTIRHCDHVFLSTISISASIAKAVPDILTICIFCEIIIPFFWPWMPFFLMLIFHSVLHMISNWRKY